MKIGGKSWTLAGARGFQILRLEQSPHDACFWLAATQGGGIFASSDCGKTFEASGRVGVGRDLYSIAFDPANPQRIALGGWGPGVVVSEDGGKSWQERNHGLPAPRVWCVIFDPEHAGRMYASVHEDQVYVSDDAGQNWKPAGLRGQRRLAHEIHPVKHLLCLLLLCVQAGASTFHERAESMLSAYNDNGYGSIGVHLKRHEQLEWCSKRLQELLAAGPTGDMFWMYPVTAIAYLDQGQLSAPARQALRRAWKTYMPYRGDTENHFLLYYTSLYLMSQLWPDADWFTGKSSQQNMEEARQWIEGWVKLTTTRGQGEYDSPHYMGVYLLPMSYLAAWAKDPAMKKRAEMMLEYLIADYAPENLDGLYVGSHARVYEDQLVEKWKGVSSDFGWLWFGLGHPMPKPGSYVLSYLLGERL